MNYALALDGYRIVQNCGREKLWQIYALYVGVGEENFGEFVIKVS